MKDKAPKAKKPIFKKWWFWVIVIVILAAIFGNTDESTEQTNTNPTTEQTQSTEQKTSSDKFISEVKTAIQGTINSDEESIVDVVLQDGDLCVTVDLSKANPEPLTIEDLAISRTGSITDAILELTDYDSEWNTITIDFGDIGKVINKKADVKENEFGGRYFPSENFTLE